MNIEKLFKDYYRQLMFYAQGFVHNELVAEDIVQETFIKAWKNDRDDLGFLYTTARNACFDHLRIHNIHARIHEDMPAEEPGTDYDMLYAEYIGTLDRLLRKLPIRQREVLILVYGGHTTAHIAFKMGISQQTVRNMKTKAMERMRNEIRALKSPQ